MNIYLKIIINALLIFFSVIIQHAFISGLPGWFAYFNLILVVFVFILGLGSFRTALGWAITAGWLLDIFSFSLFGIYLLSLSLTVLAVNFLLVNFFTNRSLYSFLALIFFAVLIYEFLLYSIGYFANLFAAGTDFLLSSGAGLRLVKQLGVNLLAGFLIFHLINFASNKLKPVFLVKKI